MTSASPTARSAAEALNRTARRIAQAARQEDWNAAVVDGTVGFAACAALFTVPTTGAARLERMQPSPAPQLSVRLEEARALRDAIDSREPVVAAWTPGEFSETLCRELSPAGFSRRAHLFPITLTRGGGEQRTVAVLMASGEAEELDRAALELVALVAGVVWQARLLAASPPPASGNDRAASASTQLIGIAGVTLPALAQVHEEEAPLQPEEEPNRELHERARRYAAVKVAEWRLYEAARVTRGRAESSLYDLFQQEIDRERARFRAVFLDKDPTMADYLHEEMIRTLAQNQAGKMGENYPGAMQHI